MIVRIVKMTFAKEHTESFLKLFDGHKDKIRAFAGCEELRLLRDQKDPRIFFTYSRWKNAGALDNYRHSELFAAVWPATKALFAAKPEAWSTDERDVML